MFRRKPERNQRVAATATPKHPLPADVTPVEPVPAPARMRPARTSLRMRLHAWHEQHLYGLFSSLGRLTTRPWATVFTVLLLGLAIALPLLFYVVLNNVRSVSGGLSEAHDIVVFLKPTVDEHAASAMADELRKRPEIATVQLRTPEQGMAEFRKLAGFGEALAVLQANPLPSVLVVTPDPLAEVAAAQTQSAHDADTNVDADLLAAIKGDARVDQVQYDAQWRQRLTALLDFGQRAMQVLAIVIGLATLLVIVETIRGDIRNHAEEIAVMQLIGADNTFVRRPFLYSGAWYGLLGGLIAVATVIIAELSVVGPIGTLVASYGDRYAVAGLSILVMVFTLVASTAIGWAGAWLASTYQLHTGHDSS